MKFADYQILPDYMEQAEVEKYCILILQEASLETVNQTLCKLKEMGNRQWHTYRLPSKEFQQELKQWLIQSWTSNTDEFLEYVLVISFDFGLDKEFYKKALDLYRGKNQREFQHKIGRAHV